MVNSNSKVRPEVPQLAACIRLYPHVLGGAFPHSRCGRRSLRHAAEGAPPFALFLADMRMLMLLARKIAN